LVKLFHIDITGFVEPGFCSMKLAFFASILASPELRFWAAKPEKALEDFRFPSVLFAGVGVELAPPLVAPG